MATLAPLPRVAGQAFGTNVQARERMLAWRCERKSQTNLWQHKRCEARRRRAARRPFGAPAQRWRSHSRERKEFSPRTHARMEMRAERHKNQDALACKCKPPCLYRIRMLCARNRQFRPTARPCALRFFRPRDLRPQSRHRLRQRRPVRRVSAKVHYKEESNADRYSQMVQFAKRLRLYPA